jgi:hypothetical protein
MYKRDKMLGMQDVVDFDSGFCQPWTYVIMLDVLCAPQTALTRSHFSQLFRDAGGTSESEEDYSRLMFIRAVLAWLAEHMFDLKDPFYKQTRASWPGDTLPFIPGITPMIPYRAPRDNVA